MKERVGEMLARDEGRSDTSEPLRVCFALPTYHPTFSGGSLRFMGYQPGLSDRGIACLVLAGTAKAKDSSRSTEELEWSSHPEGTLFPPVLMNSAQVHRVRLPDRTGLRRTTIYFRALIELCRDPKTRPDVIQVHSFERLETLFWIWRLKALGIPAVYAIQIARPGKEKSRLGRSLRRLFIRRFYGLFDEIVTSSESIRESLLDCGVASPITVIPNGVNLERFRPGGLEKRSRARKELGVREDAPVVMAVGALIARKGTDLLIEAWTRLLETEAEAELVLIGPFRNARDEPEGSFQSRVNALIEASPSPERVHMVGVRHDVHNLYAAADVLVLPTQREGGTPNVVLEAMACSVPVILTPFVGMSTAIGRPGVEFGQVGRDVESLASAVREMFRDDRLREDRRDRGLAWVRRHMDQERTLDRFARFYRNAARRVASNGRAFDEEV